MKITMFNNRLSALVITIAVLVSAPAVGDDTEVYLGASTTPSVVRPNLTFIIDTSGSMGVNVTSTTTAGEYDASESYSGRCRNDRIYWSSDGTPPSCRTSQYVESDANTCGASFASLSVGGSGYYVGRFARYRSSRRSDFWSTLSRNNHNNVIECQADWGVHGKNSSNDPYPASERRGGPWRSNSSRAINWNNTGRTYTLYSANYLNWRESAVSTTTNTRLEIVQDVFSNLMTSISNINVAVMRYDNRSREDNEGGYFVMPMAELTDANRTDYIDAVNAFTPRGYTPLAETMYEAYRYYQGGSVKFGNSSRPDTNVAGVLEPGNSDMYKSPIEYQCQKNFVVLLTDGEPTYDTDADTDIESLPSFSTVTGNRSCSGNCLDELTEYMYKQDCSNSLNDKQNVISFTIGFNTNQTLLNEAAIKGGGKYYTADDTAGLTDVFTSILTEILAINTTFIAPAVSVNAFNRFTHRDELYYALFRPNSRPEWSGNIKRFKLAGNPPIIVDKHNVAAIDSNTGFFKTTATSFWTALADAPDGDTVSAGGSASRLTLPRTIYTYTGATEPNNSPIKTTANALHEDNMAITAAMLGDAGMSSEDRTDLLKWARGVDLLDIDSDSDTTDIRRHMGDPLHTKPTLISYGGTDEAPDMTLYAGTNEGHIQAINTSDGSEVFTFVPQELLPNLNLLFVDSASIEHPYGVDGPLTAWFNDVNGNGILINPNTSLLETGEHVYLYQGMRRGGNNYYALDVTDRSAPLLKWVIKGGSGDFSELGETWSAATYGKIKLNSIDRDVLIFGGGYDTAQDDNALAQDDTVGRAIFIVDANTGEKLWQAGPAGSANGANPNLSLPAMTNSIPADITVIDTNGDGYSDRLYASDMRGQLWRFDINMGNTGASNLVTGGVIARLGGATAMDNRRFYYAPEVSLSKSMKHLNIAIGSGYRAHPLNTAVRDAFFVIRDSDIYEPALDSFGVPTYSTIVMSDLADLTDNKLVEGTVGEIEMKKAELESKRGWYIWMQESSGSFLGEKVLAKALTFDDTVMFTTYTPVTSIAGACSPSQGRALVYYMNIADASGVYDTDDSGGNLTRRDRQIDLVRGGIPPEPSMLFTKNGPVILVGTEKIGEPNLEVSPIKTYWKTE